MWETLEASHADEFRDSRNRDDGDVDAALEAGQVLEAEYRIPYLAHAPLEPMNAIVKVTDDGVEIWTGTQIPRFIQDHVAELTGFDKDAIKVHVQQMGGSFGRRLEDTYVLQAVEVAMAVKGTPVKMTWSREEDMTHDYPRPMQLSRARGTVKNGHVESFDLDIVAQSVSASWFGRLMFAPPGPDLVIIAGAWDQPLAIPNYRVTGYRAPEMVPVSSWRSVGASGNGFLHNGFLDELIHAAGADPLEELLRLCSHDVSRKVLEAVGEMSGWDGPSLGENRGLGVAFTMAFGVPTAEVVEVTNTERGIRIDKIYVASDVGRIIDPVNFEAQVFGGVIWGLGHAMNCELTYENFAPRQTNFHTYEGMRIYQTPEIMVRGLENGTKIQGIGEPAVPPAAPALANAIFAATGQRIRELPLNKHIDFV
jgi:isoquinoline 1-oxidoreductase beta subunit